MTEPESVDGYRFIASSGWSRYYHIAVESEAYADRFRARCGHYFDSEYSFEYPGPIKVAALCRSCARSIGVDVGIRPSR